MAWVEVYQQKETSSQRDGQIEHVEVWVCRTDAPATDRSWGAISADDGTTAVPAYGAEHPSGDNSFVVDKKAEKVKDGHDKYEVTVTYRSLVLGAFEADPLDRPAEFEFGDSGQSETYAEDKTSPTPVKAWATNGKPFDPPPQRDAGHMTIVVTKNFAAHDPSTDDLIKNTTNSSTVEIDGVTYGVGVLLLGLPTATKTREVINGTEHVYYRKKFTFKVNVEGWDQIGASRGYVDVDGIEIWLDKDGNVVDPDPTRRDRWPVRESWPLDDNGYPMTNSDDEPATVALQPYAAASWPYTFA